MSPLLLILAPLAAAQVPTGRLAPDLRLDGAPAEGRCGFAARVGAVASDSPDGEPIELLPGEYELRPRCQRGEWVLSPAPLQVKIEEGKTAAPRIDVRVARVRIEARRNGIMQAAKAALFTPGQKLEGEPAAIVPANQTVLVAAGRYDVLVTLEDPALRAEALAPNAKLEGPTLAVVPTNLSDGGLIVRATNNGRPARAGVRAFRPGASRDVGLVEAGQELRLPAGRYEVATELEEAADFATQRRTLWVAAGKVEQLTERFSTGQLAVQVTKDGQQVGAMVQLQRAGSGEHLNHFSAPGTVTLTPGSYDLSVETPAAGPLGAISRDAVKIGAGRLTKESIDLTPATVTAKAVENGRPVEAALILRAPGGGDAIPPESPGRWRVWPGRYELVAQLEDGTELLDGPFAAELGQRLERVARFERVSLVVVARRGKTLAEAEVLVFRPGAAKPVARGDSGAALLVAPGTYDVKVVAGGDVGWSQNLKLKKAERIEVALPEVASEDLPEGDPGAPEELPEGDG